MFAERRHAGARAAVHRDAPRHPRHRGGRGVPVQRSGDPATADGRRPHSPRKWLGQGLPLFGICFGNQILGRALGMSTYKMKFGHRGIKIPVVEHETGRIAITAQNHGFALEGEAGQEFDTPFGRAVVATPAPTTAPSRASACSTVRPSRCSNPRGRGRPARRRVPVRSFATMLEESRSNATSTDLGTILVIGSGPIVIGQACGVRLLGHAGVPRPPRGGPAREPGQLEPGHRS